MGSSQGSLAKVNNDQRPRSGEAAFFIFVWHALSAVKYHSKHSIYVRTVSSSGKVSRPLC